MAKSRHHYPLCSWNDQTIIITTDPNNMTNAEVEKLESLANEIRKQVLKMAAGPMGAHVGGCFSCAEILAVLYFSVLDIRPEAPNWVDRDHFLLSKGHASAALYAVLAARGFFPLEELATYAQPGGRLAGHPHLNVPGVEFPTGSLGHGLSLGIGLALAARLDARQNRVFVLMGDGELQEGSVWEAMMAACHYQLGNMVAIVDRNGLQITGETEKCITLEPLLERAQSFGWEGYKVNGHDVAALQNVLQEASQINQKPTFIIAHTVKGYGVDFFENRKKSHYVTLSSSLHKRALIKLASKKRNK